MGGQQYMQQPQQYAQQYTQQDMQQPQQYAQQYTQQAAAPLQSAASMVAYPPSMGAPQVNANGTTSQFGDMKPVSPEEWLRLGQQSGAPPPQAIYPGGERHTLEAGQAQACAAVVSGTAPLPAAYTPTEQANSLPPSIPAAAAAAKAKKIQKKKKKSGCC